MHRDQLNALVMMTDNNADWGIERVYAPFGADMQYSNGSAIDPKPEDIGWIGERKDAAAALQYLNARYYDPELAMFIQNVTNEPETIGEELVTVEEEIQNGRRSESSAVEGWTNDQFDE